MNRLVIYRGKFEEDGSDELDYGILLGDGTILSLDSFGIIEEEDYEIIKYIDEEINISQLLKLELGAEFGEDYTW